MYAIIKTGGKQYKVQAGDILQVEKLDQDLGSTITIGEVLMVGGDKTHVGSPLVKNASVTAVITKQARTRKVYVFKKKRRQSYRRFGTHKQSFTELFITGITSPDGQSSKTDVKPVIKDMDAVRNERIQTKISDSRMRAELTIGKNVKPEIVAKPKVKKIAHKKAAAKKATAKKAPSKRAAKKATTKKKVTKKTK
ncbi:MAG: 50S ribosomal protein L21 [Moraxellaceae bacterium]|nr:50S ribosomal protein L21 [Pseudobdellovibrionaceae bacterium]